MDMPSTLCQIVKLIAAGTTKRRVKALQPNEKKIALVGLGTVGLGWAAIYLANGFRVFAWDPAQEVEPRSIQFLNTTWPALRSLGLTELQSPPVDLLRIVGDVDEAVKDAVFIHENGPENVQTKRSIMAMIEASAALDTIIASSSGGLPPSQIQLNMQYPERMLIAHPFNPPHLVPLVEVIGGSKTSSKSIETAISHLRALRKHPIRVDKEEPGYLTNRLQFALVREAVHCLVEGIAPLESIEDALRFGLAPRWLAMGSLTTLTLAGGQGGMARMLDSFAGAIDGWWDALGQPHMTKEVKDSLIAAAAKITTDTKIETLIEQRDRALVPVLQTLAKIDTEKDNGKR